MSSNPINVLKVTKAMTLKSLLFFTRYHFKKKTNKKFTVSKPHVMMGEALERVLKGECSRLIINIMPRSGKTELGVKHLIAHGLALNPAAKFIHLSYSDSLALDNSEQIKDLVQSDHYQELYPEVQIKKSSTAKEKWYTTEGGGVLARSSGSSVTGFGAGTVEMNGEEDLNEFLSDIETKQGFGGAIIIDDPLKPDDAESDVVRGKINERFDTTIRSRINSQRTPIVIIMQRLHENDLCGYLLENEPDEWEVVCIPAIDEVGEPVFPEKFSLEYLAKLEKANKHVYDTQYMQDPKPKYGLVFPVGELKRFRRSDVDLSQRDSSVSFVDVADQGQDNHSVPFGKLLNNKIFIDDVLFTKESTEFNVPMTIEKANKHLPEFMQVESNFGGSMYIQLVRICQSIKLNGVTALIPMNASSNKHTRILTASGFIKEYFHFLHPDEYEKGSDYDLFMKNLVEYSKTKGATKHDDAPDSLAGLARMIIMYYPHMFDVIFVEQMQQ